MTTSVETKPLYERLKDEGWGSVIAESLTSSTLVAMDCKNKRTAFDLHHALNTLTTDLGVPEFDNEQQFMSDYEQSSGEPSDVPLFQRLDQEDEGVSRTVRRTLLSLSVVALSLRDQQAHDEFATAIDKFEDSLGLPTPEQFEANPDAYPNVLSHSHSAN